MTRIIAEVGKENLNHFKAFEVNVEIGEVSFLNVKGGLCEYHRGIQGNIELMLIGKVENQGLIQLRLNDHGSLDLIIPIVPNLILTERGYLFCREGLGEIILDRSLDYFTNRDFDSVYNLVKKF